MEVNVQRLKLKIKSVWRVVDPPVAVKEKVREATAATRGVVGIEARSRLLMAAATMMHLVPTTAEAEMDERRGRAMMEGEEEVVVEMSPMIPTVAVATGSVQRAAPGKCLRLNQGW